MRKITQMQVLERVSGDAVVLAVTEDGSFWRGVLPRSWEEPDEPVRWSPLNTPPERMPPVPGAVKKTKVPSNVVVGRNVDPERVEAVVQRETPPEGVRGTSS